MLDTMPIIQYYTRFTCENDPISPMLQCPIPPVQQPTKHYHLCNTRPPSRSPLAPPNRLPLRPTATRRPQRMFPLPPLILHILLNRLIQIVIRLFEIN